MAINPALVLKHIISDCTTERHCAADKLYAAAQRHEWHPDDWTRDKGGKAAKIGSRDEEVLRKDAERRAKHAEASAEIEREAREKAEAEIEKLHEQLNKERARASGPTKQVKLLSGLLPARILDALTAEQVSAKIDALKREKGNRKQNETAQIDLALGQLTFRLHNIWDDMFGSESENPRKRGDRNTPTMAQFVEDYAGRSASWCQRCCSALNHVLSDDWPTIKERLGDCVSVEGINKAARSLQDRPTVRRVSKLRKKLDALTDAVRRRAIDEAVGIVEFLGYEPEDKGSGSLT